MPTTQNTNVAWDFLREIYTRFTAKNPFFFNVFAWISSIAAFITGFPALLESIPGLVVPEAFEVLQNKIVTVAAIVVFIMSNLATQRPVVDDEGNTVVPGSKNTLPFTDSKEGGVAVKSTSK